MFVLSVQEEDLRELNKQKRDYVEKEDYQNAFVFKHKIEGLHQQLQEIENNILDLQKGIGINSSM